MHAQRACLILFLTFAISDRATLAAEPELKPGKVCESSLSAGQAQSFAVSLGEGDFARIAVNPRGQAFVVKTYDPSGKPFRGAEIGPQEGELNLVAEGAGAYRVEVSAVDKHATGTYTIALKKVVTLAARLAPPKPVVESNRIRALRAAVERGDRESVDAFWEEVKKTGAPLIEPIPGDRENMAVTFLYKGGPYTHNVMVLWIPYAGVTPDEFLMTHLGKTDVWYKTIKVDRKMRLSYTLAPNAARLHPLSLGIDADGITMTAAAAMPDPLNLRHWRVDPQSVDAPEFRGSSILEMPDAAPQPWAAQRPGVPAGRVEKRRFKSAALNNEREVAIYLPPGYSPRAEPYPLLVVFDEDAYLTLVPTPTILDNLISEARIPPVVALLIGNVPGARDRELVCNPEFTRALVDELLPWAHGLYNFTNDPRHTVVAGSSAGGIASACAGLWHPETFGNVLAQSGAFHLAPPSSHDTTDSNSEPNWLARQFISSPKKPLRFYLDAGSAEFNATGGADSILFCTRTLRDVLRAKGYEVHFQEFAGGHDYLSWRGTLADGLIALMGDTTSRKLSESASAPPSWSWPPVQNFITASGSGLQGGLKFMGANLDPWRFNTAIGEVYSQAEIGDWVANAVRYTHARVIRMHMNGGAFEPSVGVYGESAFKQLDYLLAAAARNNVYVLIALRDYCWTPWPPGRCYDSYWHMNGGSAANPGKDNILIHSDTIAAYKRFIAYVVNRVNTVTAVRYKDDPHIIGWEIINEPNMVSGIKNWFVDIGAYVKSVDPNHLVGVATGDLAQSGWEPGAANWDALNIPQLDFIDIHYYADFYNPGNTDWAQRYNQILRTVRTLNKPVIMGEFGCPNNDPLAKITNLYQTIIADSIAGGLSGVMPYSWGPPGPNRLGGSGAFCVYTDDTGVCERLRNLAPSD